MLNRNIPQDMAASAVARILNVLNTTIPDLTKGPADHGYTFEFIVHIRDGLIGTLEMDSWDDAYKPFHLNRPEPLKDVLEKLQNWALRTLQTRFVRGFHGRVDIRFAYCNGQAMFGKRTKRTEKFDL